MINKLISSIILTIGCLISSLANADAVNLSVKSPASEESSYSSVKLVSVYKKDNDVTLTFEGAPDTNFCVAYSALKLYFGSRLTGTRAHYEDTHLCSTIPVAGFVLDTINVAGDDGILVANIVVGSSKKVKTFTVIVPPRELTAREKRIKAREARNLENKKKLEVIPNQP